MSFRKLLVIGCLFPALPAASQVMIKGIDKEEYKVVSVALGKRTERVFMSGQTGCGTLLTLRNEVHPPKAPTVSQPPSGPALRQPKREPSEAMKRHVLEEHARLEDAEAFRAQISDETIEDWMKKNAISYEWEDRFDFTAPTVLLSSKLVHQLPRNPKDYWSQLRTMFPDLIAVTEASRVGFNRARTQAVVLLGFATVPLGGEGEYVLLEKQGGRWSVVHRLRAWLS